MLAELLSLFRTEGPGKDLRDDLDRMVRLSADVVARAGDVYFRREGEPEAAKQISSEDKKINELQRVIRKNALVQAVAGEHPHHLPFCLSLMNIVKDVERLGDYAKGIARLAEKAPASDPSSYAGLALEAERLTESLAQTLQDSDQVQAVKLIDVGKDLRKRINAELFARVLSTDPEGARHTLCLQYYQRIVSHALNVLSTIVTPLHRMDYTGKGSLLPEVKDKLSEAAEIERP